MALRTIELHGTVGEIVRDSTWFLGDRDPWPIDTYLLPNQQTTEIER